MMAPPIAKNPNAGKRSEGTNCHRSTRWVKFRAMLLARNAMCQRIWANGQPCKNAAVIAHHLVSPLDRPDLQFVASNVVCVCRQCHPNTRGEPKDSKNVYTKTIGLDY